MNQRPSIDTAFLFPVIDDQLYLGQRGTPPFASYWGAVGGKSDVPTENNPWDEPHLIEKMGGAKVICVADRFARRKGREHLQGTAVREFCTEIFSNRNFPRGFEEGDITDIIKLGFVSDVAEVRGEQHDVSNYFYIARVHRKGFSLSPREITGFKPITDLTSEDKLFPIGKIALIQIYYSLMERIPPFLYGYEPILDQIRPIVESPGFLRPEECRFTSMMGPYAVSNYAESIKC